MLVNQFMNFVIIHFFYILLTLVIKTPNTTSTFSYNKVKASYTILIFRTPMKIKINKKEELI